MQKIIYQFQEFALMQGRIRNKVHYFATLCSSLFLTFTTKKYILQEYG